MASPSEMISVQPTVRFFKQMTIGVEDEQYGGGIGDTTTVHLRATHCPCCMVHTRAESEEEDIVVKVVATRARMWRWRARWRWTSVCR